MAINISTIVIDASLQRVWDVLTEPALIKKWQFGSDVFTDLKVGSSIRFKTAWEDTIFEQWGKIIEVRPKEIIKYSLFAPRPGLEDNPENYFIMSYKLTEEGQKTNLKIVQEDNRPNAIQEDEQGEDNPVLKAVKDLAEAN